MWAVCWTVLLHLRLAPVPEPSAGDTQLPPCAIHITSADTVILGDFLMTLHKSVAVEHGIYTYTTGSNCGKVLQLPFLCHMCKPTSYCFSHSLTFSTTFVCKVECLIKNDTQVYHCQMFLVSTTPMSIRFSASCFLLAVWWHSERLNLV